MENAEFQRSAVTGGTSCFNSSGWIYYFAEDDDLAVDDCREFLTYLFNNSAGQLRTTVIGDAVVSSGAFSKNRWPSAETEYVCRNAPTGSVVSNSARGVSASKVAPGMTVTAVSFESSAR